MNVKDILERTADESLGGENVASGERAMHLRFLNVCYRDVYKAVAPYNFMALRMDTVPSVGGVLTLPQRALNINRIVHKAMRADLSEISLYQRAADKDGSLGLYTLCWNRGSNMKTVSLAWKEKDGTEFTVLWVPSCVDLKETSTEDDIPFPVEFHDLLVDGTLIRIDADTGGFAEPRRVMDAKVRYEEGKNRMINWFYNNWGHRLSTYTSV